MAHFHFVNKKKGMTKEELLKEIKDLTNEEFKHHVNQEKNDFANYVKDVLKDEKLAMALKKTTSKKKTEELLRNKKTTSKKKPRQKSKTERKENKAEQAKNEKKEEYLERRLPTRQVSYINTETPQTFILKEFLLGALFGLLLGLILMAMITSRGLYF